jgi:hypothetical protein
MGLSDPKSQAVFSLWHGNQVNMVGHQAIGPDLHGTLPAPLRHERDVGLVILICEEGRQSAVAPLGDMMGDAGSHDACDASHGSMISILFPLMQGNN